ncbi:MAG: hypothetical protein WBR26_01090 [Candidatus Acidiferrum sp.]
MKDLLNEHFTLRFFQERTTAELRLALDEVKWWKDRVASGQVTPERAKRHIETAKRIINNKRHILGCPEFPS